MAAPASWNLYAAANLIKNGDCRMLVIGDSINTQTLYYSRMGGIGYFYTWKPAAWKGFFFNANNYTAADLGASSAGTGQSVAQLGTPKISYLGAASAKFANGYGYFNRSWNNYQYNFAAMSVSGSPAGTPVYGANPNLFPMGYTEQQFDGTALPSTSTVYWYCDIENEGLTYMYGGDPFTGKTITARVVGYKNTNGPVLQFSVYNNTSTTATVDVDFGGTAGYVSAERTYTAASALQRAQLSTKNPTGITSSKPFILLGYKFWNAALTTGLQIAVWAEAGWYLADAAGSTIATTQALADWGSYALGDAGATGPTNGPNVYWIHMGRNDIAGGYSRATLMANARTLVAKCRAAAALQGVTNVHVVLCSPFRSAVGEVAASTFADAADALYRVAQELSCGFLNYYQLQAPEAALPIGRQFTTNAVDERLIFDAIHPNGPGSMYFASLAWSQIEAALDNASSPAITTTAPITTTPSTTRAFNRGAR